MPALTSGKATLRAPEVEPTGTLPDGEPWAAGDRETWNGWPLYRVTRTGALDKAARMASSCAEQARAELTGLPNSTRLAELATSAADRQR